MSFQINKLYDNLDVNKKNISKSFLLFLDKYIPKMIDYYLERDDWMTINFGDITIDLDKKLFRYILLITENPETSLLLHDKIYGMIYHSVKFLINKFGKCSFESVIEINNDTSIDISTEIKFFYKPMIFYMNKINPDLIIRDKNTNYINYEKFDLFIDLCNTMIYPNLLIHNTIKKYIYNFLSSYIRHFLVFLNNNTDNTDNMIINHINIYFVNYLKDHINNQINMYIEFKNHKDYRNNWINLKILEILNVPGQYIPSLKIIIQYFIFELINIAGNITINQNTKIIYPIHLFLGIENNKNMLTLPIFAS